MPAPAQSLANHTRLVPLFHLVTGALVFAYLCYAVLELRHFSLDAIARVVLGAALALLFWYVRAFPVAVQDRVIQLEMRLRLQQLAPDLVPRLDQLAPAQVIALRFAGDDELAALTREVLDGRLAAPIEIKRRIRNWKADDLRV